MSNSTDLDSTSDGLFLGIKAVEDAVSDALAQKPEMAEIGKILGAAAEFVGIVVSGFSNWVLGSIGAILAVPMSIIVQAILDSRDETRWLAYMMGSGKEPFNPEEDLGQEELE